MWANAREALHGLWHYWCTTVKTKGVWGKSYPARAVRAIGNRAHEIRNARESSGYNVLLSCHMLTAPGGGILELNNWTCGSEGFPKKDYMGLAPAMSNYRPRLRAVGLRRRFPKNRAVLYPHGDALLLSLPLEVGAYNWTWRVQTPCNPSAKTSRTPMSNC